MIKIKMKLLKAAGRIYDRNPVSYRILRDLEEQAGMGNFLKAVFILPLIPVWNLLARVECYILKKHGSVYRIRNGRTLFYLPAVDLGDGEFVQNRIFLERGYFEQRRLKQIRPYITGAETILDIGANIGNHTLFFIKECAAKKVYAFEPVKSTFEILQKNIAINGLKEQVVLHNFALGDHRGKGNIIYCKGDAGGNQIAADETGDAQIAALDDLCFAERIDFIKIDVEGYEEKVLTGAGKTLKKDHPVIMIEIFDQNYQRVNDLLVSVGYQCRKKIGNDYIYVYVPKTG